MTAREIVSSPPPGPSVPVGRKPRADEIDVYGLTHPGKVRRSNQDHFLIGSLNRQMQVHLTSLTDLSLITAPDDRLAFLAVVADGVGGSAGGEEASRFAVEAVTQYVVQSMRCYYGTDPGDTAAFAQALEDAALKCHAALIERGQEDPEQKGMATTLTLWLGVWPRAYLLQMGDSRCYIMRDGQLRQISRDQTMVQDLLDQGVFTRTDAQRTPFAGVLTSAIGGRKAAPVVTSLDQAWGTIGLLCSDGLTKHVPDERIAERLRTMTSAKQACEALVQDALDGGGTDNVTVVVGRTVVLRA